MTLLRVRKGRFPFGDGVLTRGETIDSHDYPDIGEMKWSQLIEHRFFDLVDSPGNDSARQVAEVERAKQITVTPVDAPESTVHEADDLAREIASVELGCPACEFVAKSPHGLKVHVGRRHKV